MELLTNCQANRMRVRVTTVRKDTARPGMESLTCYYAQQHQIGSEDSKKGHSWTWHGITHFLLSQQDQNGSEDSEKEHS